jgi:phosphorylcholine metabolism protein LicD
MTGTKKSRKELIILYKNIMEFLKGANVTLILFYGSLLGYCRESNFINDDDDIDIIVSRNDFIKLKKYIDDNISKYPKITKGIIHDDIMQLNYSEELNSSIGPFDIYAYDYYDTMILLKWDGNLLYEQKHIFPLQNIIFNDYNISIPYDMIEIIEQTYGDNWQIPLNKGQYNDTVNRLTEAFENIIPSCENILYQIYYIK